MESVLDSVNVLDCPHIAEIATESQQNEITARENVEDTDKALVRSRSLVDSYRPLAHFTALLFNTAHNMCITLNYPTFSLVHFQELITTLLAQSRHSRPQDDPAACHDHILHLKKRVMIELHRHLKMHMFRRHHLLFPLLVVMTQLMGAGQISSEEYNILGVDPGALQDLQITVDQRPDWLSQQVR